MNGAGEGPRRRPVVPLREAARRIAETLRAAGHQALFAGGCVRDRLMAIEPADYDIATDATPAQVQRIFPRARGVGEAFGVMLVRGDGHVFEVATFRTDLEYVDGRRPTSVRFATAKEDAERRDFTINGLFEDPQTGEVIDWVGGRADIAGRVLRAIGDPDRRFAEDHLRLLRAIRFAARFGLSIESATAAAMRRDAPKLALIAKERIGMEVRRMLEGPSPAQAASMTEAFGLDAIILAESPTRSVGARLAELPPPIGFPLGLVAWGLDRRDVGSAADLETGRTEAWRTALVLSNDEVERIGDISACRRELGSFAEVRECRRKRLAGRAGFRDALALVRVEDPGRAAGVQEWLDATDPASISPSALLRGDHLIELGVAPGPIFRDLLDATYDAQLEGRVRTLAEATALAREFLLQARPTE